MIVSMVFLNKDSRLFLKDEAERFQFLAYQFLMNIESLKVITYNQLGIMLNFLYLCFSSIPLDAAECLIRT